MKLVLLIAAVVALLWLVRSTARKPNLPPRPEKPSKVEHEDMVSCAQCGVHLPRSEAFPGRGGVFCSEAHRSAYESQRSR